MKKLLIVGILPITLLFAGCGVQNSTILPKPSDRLSVVTSFYPLYEIAMKVGGAHVTVRNLVPAGAEPHDYEPSPKDVIAMNQAKLVLYNGAGLESWADKIIPDLEKAGVATLNESITSEEAPGTDPHTWLDPNQYIEEVRGVAKKLAEIDPPRAIKYQQNADAFINGLADLDASYKDGLKTCEMRYFVTNHAAFSYLSKRYGLEMIPIAGLSPDAEPSPKTLINLTNLIEQKGIKYILVETLVSPKVAEVLARETGAQTLVLNPLEGLTQEEMDAGKNYISIMRDNLTNLKAALQCR